MKFTMIGGGTYGAAAPLALVEAMRADAQQWAPSVGIEDYMEAVAERAQKMNGRPVAAGAPWPFMRDMMRAGFLMPAIPINVDVTTKLDVQPQADFVLGCLRELLPTAAHRAALTEYGWEYWSRLAPTTEQEMRGGCEVLELLHWYPVLGWIEEYVALFKRTQQAGTAL